MAVDFSELEAALTPGALVTDPASTEAYRFDRAEDPTAEVPAAVVKAATTEDVQAAVRFAAANGLSVVPRGAGSGLSGGASGRAEGIVISTERMTALSVDPVTRTATAQAGCFNSDVKKAAAAEGLWYPPDPSSFEISSIGGNFATNAGGLCCVKYGVTTDYVLGATVVLADGRAVQLGGKLIKDVAGLSLLKLFVGSEGTLGIVTEVVVRLIPAQSPSATLVSTFPSLEAVTDAVLGITREMRPSMLEFIDRVAINVVEDELRMGLDRDAAALLIAKTDGAGGEALREIERIVAICEAHGATETYATDDPEEGEAFTVARRMTLPCLEKLGPALIDDVGVPLDKLGELVAGIERIAAARDVIISVCAHAGDGNTHPVLVLDPNDEAQQQRAWAAFGEIMQLAIGLGGTITGEHGVGRLKRPWLADRLGDDVTELNLRIKRALDPDGVLNPGVML